MTKRYHSFEYPNETINGSLSLEILNNKWESIKCPNLQGKDVLDIGCWDGFFSMKAAQSANYVLGIDIDPWGTLDWVVNFREAREQFGFKRESVEYRMLSIYNIDKLHRNFDVVFMLGVLYHLKHPLLGLEKVFDITNELAIIESHVDLTTSEYPYLKFYPSNELANDYSNWWSPNPRCLEEMLKVVGFTKIELIQDGQRVIYHAYK